jgi:hypothetical protein
MKEIKNWNNFTEGKKSPWTKKDYKYYSFYVQIESTQIVGEGDIEEALSKLEKSGASDITVNKLDEYDLERLYGSSDDSGGVHFPPSDERE